MRKKKFGPTNLARYLFIVGLFSAGLTQAAVVNLTFSEDATSFSSSWRITDNGSGDFSGMDSIIGTFWQVELMADSTPSLQETIGHILGPHGESFEASSIGYGALPTEFFTVDSFTLHNNGHRDDFTLSSDFVDGGYTVSLSGIHSIPIPASLWLFGSGLGFLGWLKRKARS